MIRSFIYNGMVYKVNISQLIPKRLHEALRGVLDLIQDELL